MLADHYEIRVHIMYELSKHKSASHQIAWLAGSGHENSFTYCTSKMLADHYEIRVPILYELSKYKSASHQIAWLAGSGHGSRARMVSGASVAQARSRSCNL
jgi:hypothetical protein